MSGWRWAIRDAPWKSAIPAGEAEYVERYGEAADALVAERYLLPADAETLKESAAAAWRAAIAAPE